MTATLTRLDPFTDAECRRPGADPRWWDDDAPRTVRAQAAFICGRCTARPACSAAADTLGATASGTWAGTYRQWPGATQLEDETLNEYLAVFGPSPVHNDLPAPITAVPVRYGRYWVHPSQMKFEYDHHREAI